MKALKEVLAYSNPRIIAKFREDYYFDKEEAELIFKETLKWLWLAAKTQDESRCGMYHPMLVMDKMWHSFVAFTRDYTDFCNANFERLIHHEPHTRDEMVARMTPSQDDPDLFKRICDEIGAFQSYVYDVLSAETLLRWFVTFPHVYSPEELQRRSRPQFAQRGFMQLLAMRSMTKEELLAELAKSHAIAAWCGGQVAVRCVGTPKRLTNPSGGYFLRAHR